MADIFKVLPPFAPDYSGVVSVLFDFQGLIIINGADGCTGNVVGYDEPRFFTQKSTIYSSGLRELRAVMGDEDFLIDYTSKILDKHKFNFAAILQTPASSIIATDHKACARILEDKFEIPVFAFDTTGVDTYEKGASEAFLEMARKLIKPGGEKIPNAVNILGAIPLDYWGKTQIENIKKALNRYNIRINSCWSMDEDIENILLSNRASYNLVISVSGLKVAKYMKEKFDIPYICIVPIGKHLTELIVDIVLGQRRESNIQKKQLNKKILIIAEQIWANSLRKAIELEYDGVDVKIASFFDMTHSLEKADDERISSEDELENILARYKPNIIIGDPLFKNFSTKTTPFLEIPHLAISSRLYWDNKIQYTGIEAFEKIKQFISSN